jgi:hypothetical protein
MRKLTRRAVAGALAAPLMLVASAGVSVADSSSYTKRATGADEHGAWTKRVSSHAETDNGHGGDRSSYHKATTSADKHGARTKAVKSDASTGGHNGYGHDGYSKDGHGHNGYGHDGSVYSLSGYGQKDITVWFDSMFN